MKMKMKTTYRVCLLKRGARKPIECWNEPIWDDIGHHRSEDEIAIEFADQAHRRGEEVIGKTLTISYAGTTQRFAIERWGGSGLVSTRRIR